MFAQEPPPDFDVSGRREPGERPELVAEVGLVEVACAIGGSLQSIGPHDSPRTAEERLDAAEHAFFVAAGDWTFANADVLADLLARQPDDDLAVLIDLRSLDRRRAARCG